MLDIKNKSISEDYLLKLNKDDIKGCIYILKIKKYEIIQITDNQGLTIFHKVSKLNLYEDCIQILELIINNCTKYEFYSCINQKNKLGFTPLHYACYNGNMKLIKLLINNGADVNLVNNNGLNVLHLAAQGNQATPIYYFIHKYKMNVNSTDKMGNTSLHWACFFNNDKVFNFLLLCDKININIKNKNGFTPLHFSVLSRNIKAIKKLITSGGDITIKNNENQTCLNIAYKKNYKEIKDLLLQSYYLIKYNSYTVVSFYSFHVIMPILIIYFILGNFFQNYNILIYIIWNIFLFSTIFYFNRITNLSNLKLKKNNKRGNLLKLIEDKNIDINNYCPKCNIFININYLIKHCYICNSCIEEFDHHCIWIGKCIGKDNKRIFLLLLILIELNFLINLIICFIIEPLIIKKNKIILHQLNNENIIHILFLINLLILICGSIIIIPLIKSNIKKLKTYNDIYFFNKAIRHNTNIKEKNKENNYNEAFLSNNNI